MKELVSTTVAIILSVFATVAIAVPISVDLVNDHSDRYHEGTACDSVTGKCYRKVYGSNDLRVFDSRADMEADAVSGTLTLQGQLSGGTYFEAHDGKIFARKDTNSNGLSRYDANTGTLEATGMAPDMGGNNGTHSFQWGGFTAVNVMGDGSDLYVFGRAANLSQWILHQFDSSLSVFDTDNIAAGTLGFGFVMNGVLFAGTSYSAPNPTITIAYDIATNSQTVVDFTLMGIGGGGHNYLTNFDYSRASDTLYISDVQGSPRSLYAIRDAGAKFGSPIASVPEPGTLALLGLGFAGMGMIRRKKKVRTTL